MGMMDTMMGSMMGKMSSEDKKNMMDSMMNKFFGEMNVDDKKQMMVEMMPRMMGGIDMQEMMPKMMMSMMGDDLGEGGKMGMISKMMSECVDTMFPKMANQERTEFVSDLLIKMVKQGLDGLSEPEKGEWLMKVVEAVKA